MLPFGARCIAGALVTAGLLAGCGSDTTTVVEKTSTIVQTVTGGDSTAETTTAARPEVVFSGTGTFAFQTPSGNVGCAITSQFVNCSIVEASWTPPNDPSCPSSAGRSVSLDSGTPAAQCGMPEPPNGTTLDYNTQVGRGDFTCVSQMEGLRCEGAGHSFFLSRERFDSD
jgi:hypothetical protein